MANLIPMLSVTFHQCNFNYSYPGFSVLVVEMVQIGTASHCGNIM